MATKYGLCLVCDQKVYVEELKKANIILKRFMNDIHGLLLARFLSKEFEGRPLAHKTRLIESVSREVAAMIENKRFR
jgi:hypothetical protein